MDGLCLKILTSYVSKEVAELLAAMNEFSYAEMSAMAQCFARLREQPSLTHALMHRSWFSMVLAFSCQRERSDKDFHDTQCREYLSLVDIGFIDRDNFLGVVRARKILGVPVSEIPNSVLEFMIESLEYYLTDNTDSVPEQTSTS
jgi:hypothetical protein